MDLGKGAVPVLKGLDYFGVTFWNRVAVTKDILEMVSHVQCFQLRSYDQGFAWMAPEGLRLAAHDVGGNARRFSQGRAEEIMEFSRGPPFTRKFYVGQFPFLPW
jgi:hypothetical protein